jgi:SAM-dependent methyltransferase
MVAGVPLSLDHTEFSLHRCAHCGFQFKHPAIDPARLLACYAAAVAGHWGDSPDPRLRQFDVLKATLERHAAGRRVLDVGCFNGAFLQYLGDSWNRFGIEPSIEAARVARARGIDVLAPTLEDLPTATPGFDAVLAIDVVEHLGNPVPFFQRVSTHLNPGGVLIVLTGDTDALAWRLQGSRYWYCSLPEHVSFYNRQALETLAQSAGLHCLDCRRMRHKRLGLGYWCLDTVKSAGYLAGLALAGLGVPGLRRPILDRRGPTIQSARDHLLGVLQKRVG